MYPTPKRFHAIVIPVALVAAVAATWPVAAHLSDHVIDGAALIDAKHPESFWAGSIGVDVLTTVWILNRVLRVLITHPFQLFEANIFYPTPLAGALQELLFATDLLGIPGALVGGPIFAHQTALLLCLVTTAWSTAYVVARWTGSVLGGLVAGVLFAGSPFHQYQLYHLQSLGTAYFALLLLGLERLGATGHARWAALAAGAMVLQTLSGQYLGYIALVALIAAGIVALVAGRPAPSPARRIARDVALLAGAGVLGAVLLLPFVVPYVRLIGIGHIPEERAGRLHSLVDLSHYFPNRWDFPGIPWAAWVLAFVGLVIALGRRERPATVQAVMLTALGALGAWVSLGPHLVGGVANEAVGVWAALDSWRPWDLFAAYLPGFASMREPIRFTLLPCLAIAMLGGFGAAALASRFRRGGPVIALGLTVFAFVAAGRGVLPLRRVPVGDEVPAVYPMLARCGDGDPLLELPMGLGWDEWRDGEPQFFSIYHWLPLLNGRASYVPPAVLGIRKIANYELPRPAAIEELQRRTGVRWVLVRCTGWGRDTLPSVIRLCADEPWPGRPSYVFGTMRLYDLGRVPVLPRPVPRRPQPSEGCMVGTGEVRR